MDSGMSSTHPHTLLYKEKPARILAIEAVMAMRRRSPLADRGVIESSISSG
jgi:hypothetical protein